VVRYFKLKGNQTSKYKSLVFREKPEKFSKKCKEIYIKKTESLIITGMHSSGKTREINKIIKNREVIYKNTKFIILKGTDSLSDWFIHNINDEDVENHLNGFDEDEKIVLEKEIKKQYMRVEILKTKSKNSILIIDDLDKLNGKKKEIVKDLIRDSKVVIATAKELIEIDRTISSLLHYKKYKEISLGTNQSYDATNILFVMILMGMVATGAYELAVLIMAGRYAIKGKDRK